MKIKWLMIIVIPLAIISYLVLVQGDKLESDEVLKIGEEKYLEFMWIVDSAFEDKEITVNNKHIEDSQKTFKCEYKDKKDECLVENFEEVFKNLFSKNISYNKVYGDDITFSRLHIIDNQYIFSSIKCSDTSKSNDFELKVKSIESDKLTYTVTSSDKRLSEKVFILINEDNSWKIKEAYYRDKCMMDYYIS